MNTDWLFAQDEAVCNTLTSCYSKICDLRFNLKLQNVQSWCCWRPVILTMPDKSVGGFSWGTDTDLAWPSGPTEWVCDKCHVGKTAWLLFWFFVETKLEYPTHHHLSKSPPPPVFCLCLYACGTICGGIHIHTRAHKSTLNIMVTENIMTFRHKLYSICSANYNLIWFCKAAEEAP